LSKVKTDKAKQYIYIVQALLEPAKCKIGKTNDLERRLKEYNNMTGKSKDNIYQYLFTCETKDMDQLENAIKEEFSTHREEKSKEIYFYNIPFFNDYVNFVKSHKLFVKETFIKTAEPKKQIIKIVSRTKPSLAERGVTKKDILQKAQKVKNDEYYTRYEDVEKEISMYNKSIWKNKVVFCNCDDAVDADERKTSAFSLYFIKHFKELELKKLICTHYVNIQPDLPFVDLFDQGPKGYIFTKKGYREFGKKEYPDKYNGSFDHPLSIKILNEEVDIVCTNPPFSKAKEYWELIIGSGKKFLIVSGETNVKNDSYIPYFINKKVWAGYNDLRWFLTPKRELTRAAAFWFTNIKIKSRPKSKNLKIIPLKDIPEKYRKYDDKKTLLVDFCYIPNDYKKPFAVSTTPILSGLLEKGFKIVKEKQYRPYVNGKEIFARVLVQKI
jgi:predicted GIY-YIG superfamily endonuclease